MRDEASRPTDQRRSWRRPAWSASGRVLWSLTLLVPLALFARALPDEIARLFSSATEAEHALHGAARASLVAWFIEPGRYALLTGLLEAALMVAFTLAAVVIGWRAPRDRMAFFISVTLVSFGALSTPALDSLVAAQPQWELPARVVRAVGLECEVLIFYLSPDGRFFPRWTRLLAVVWTLWRLVELMAPAAQITFVAPTPRIPVQAPSALALLGLFAAYVFWIGSGLVAQIVRFRTTSTPVQRQQTKWAMIAVVVAVAAYVVYVLPRLALPTLREPGPDRLVYGVTVLPLYLTVLFLVPLVITFSMLRFRLWNVDLVIQRTLLYASLTGALGAVYLGSVTALQWLFRTLTGQTSSISIVVSTLASAALFLPLRDRMQVTIDRRFYRRRYNAARAIAAMGAALQHEVDLERISEQLVEIVERTMHPTHVSLWLREPARDRPPGPPI